MGLTQRHTATQQYTLYSILHEDQKRIEQADHAGGGWQNIIMLQIHSMQSPLNRLTDHQPQIFLRSNSLQIVALRSLTGSDDTSGHQLRNLGPAPFCQIAACHIGVFKTPSSKSEEFIPDTRVLHVFLQCRWIALGLL